MNYLQCHILGGKYILTYFEILSCEFESCVHGMVYQRWCG